MDEVRQWLQTINLGKYADKFEEHEYDSMRWLKKMDGEDWNELQKSVGLKTGAVAKLKQKLEELKDADGDAKNDNHKIYENVYGSFNDQYKLQPIGDPQYKQNVEPESRYKTDSDFTNPYKQTQNHPYKQIQSTEEPKGAIYSDIKNYKIPNEEIANPYRLDDSNDTKTQDPNVYSGLNEEFGTKDVPSKNKGTVYEPIQVPITRQPTSTNPYQKDDVDEADEDVGVTQEEIDQQRDSVCRMYRKSDDNSGTGFLAEYRGQVGIMTNHHVISEKSNCREWKPGFNYEKNKNPIDLELTPDTFFVTDKSLDVTFVSCKGAIEAGITPFPLSKNKKVKVKDQIHIYQHPDGRTKEKAEHIVTKSEETNFHYVADTEAGSSGSPVFCSSKLVGVHHGYKEIAKGNEGIHIHKIIEWLQKDSYFRAAESKNSTFSGGSTTTTTTTMTIEKTKDQKLEEINKWLQELKLAEKYFDKFKQSDYCDFEKIKKFDQIQIDTMIKEIGFKRGSAKKIRISLESLARKPRGKKMQKVYEWLCTLNLEHYADQFEEHEYDSITMLNRLESHEIDQMAKDLGLKAGAVAKIKQDLLE